jgi:Fur family transcriptional regulator, peroxide stress response regulator
VKKKSRKTKQLEVIWDAIKEDASHPTADQVYERVRKKLPNISLGTVYRNLQKLLVDEKLQVLTLGRQQHFDPLVESHQHFICEQCNRVYDVLVEEQKEVKPIKLPHAGFRVTSHQLAFYGTCKHCSS